MKTAVLFDLDQTLLDTSALADARARGDWDYALSNLASVKPFFTPGSPLPHQMPGVLHGMGHPVAIVTSSPGRYARPLLAKFQVHCDALVAYEDTSAHKPDPDPLNEALRRLGTNASNAYYVGDAVDDFAASYNAGIRSIGAGWNPEVDGLWQTAADILLYDTNPLLNPDSLPRCGYVAEVLAAGLQPLMHRGSFLRSKSSSAIGLGRYFPTADARHGSHVLSGLILKLKGNDEHSPMFGAAVANYVAFGLSPQPDFATCVPPKPSQDRIRFAKTLEHMKTYVPGVAIYPDGMRATREVEDYKHTRRDERAALVQGAFESKYAWGKKDVLLLDDVFTSGSTTDECARVLINSNAANVRTVCISVDQNVMNTRRCPNCSRVLKVYTNRRDDSHFWGCPNYFTPINCRYKTSYDG
ncbi:hypothetical protein CYFUS_001675 [Cystobacter fuscus]|uniref:phosphoglycolate phosphatase n=1 Tax=Cystobacter fuscus TaxID=43 RepID=A0A250IYM6_9BACT|nr:HAD-IA family hydrolase [Cystobacter fuscus]ATB36261.1 hypothetical protein CYFUS_001675 [Cystobacter fuscus]